MKFSIYAISALVLGACSVPGGTGGNFEVRTEELTGKSFTQTPSTGWSEDADPWWLSFKDPALDALVQRAQLGNPNLAAAAQDVLAAIANSIAIGGDRGSKVDVGLNASRGFVTNGGDRAYGTSLRPNLQLAWQEDLFGGLKSRERSALSLAKAQENLRLALTHSVIAALARTRVRLSVIDRRLELARSVVQSRQATLDIVQGRYQRGVEDTAAIDVRLARENLAGAEANLPALELEGQLAQNALHELLGEKPSGSQKLQRMSALPEVPAPPVGLPANLLDRRPDLRAANFRVQASASDMDVALAALYPDLRITAQLGWDSSDWDDLFDSDALFGSLIGDLSTRIFGSGSLQAGVESAKARMLADAHTYRAQVLAALREVEDALASETYLRQQLEKVTQQLNEAKIAEGLARDRYSTGVGPLLRVLDTERRRAQTEDLQLRLQEAIWNARIDLHLSIGGDWHVQDPLQNLTADPHLYQPQLGTPRIENPSTGNTRTENPRGPEARSDSNQ